MPADCRRALNRAFTAIAACNWAAAPRLAFAAADISEKETGADADRRDRHRAHGRTCSPTAAAGHAKPSATVIRIATKTGLKLMPASSSESMADDTAMKLTGG
jgi:hypothetical protein